MGSLEGKSAIITGSARGIGKNVAEVLARAGAKVAIVDLALEDAQRTADEIKKEIGVNTCAIQANVTSTEDVDTMIKTALEAFGTISIFVNNAGITKDGLLMRMKEADWDAVINVNLKSAFLCTKAVMRPMMKERYGKIVNMASVIGLTGNAGQANYAASKAGLIGLTKSTAKELATRNINVNAVAPGFIQTAMTDKLRPEDKDKITKAIPMGKLGTTQNVADLVCFLASPESDYITGQVITVDGGLVM